MAGLADLGLGLPISAWWWLIRWLGLRWVWLFADLNVVVWVALPRSAWCGGLGLRCRDQLGGVVAWACAAEIGLGWWLGLALPRSAWGVVVVVVAAAVGGKDLVMTVGYFG
uniref:Uncharacterized protein n=1 Tax=Fagus sylvatica TaxID=28930 RepID=A0A2N9GRA9_FAGSY